MSNYYNYFMFLNIQRAPLTKHVRHAHSYIATRNQTFSHVPQPSLKPPQKGKKNPTSHPLPQKNVWLFKHDEVSMVVGDDI
jgi:hypothetical protein